MKDLYNNVKGVIALVPQAIASDTDTVGVIIDTLGYESVKLSLSTGAVTAGTVVIKEVNESDSSSMASETVIPAGRLTGTIATVSTANTINEIGIYPVKRYIRVEVTTASSADLVVAGLCDLGHPAIASVR